MTDKRILLGVLDACYDDLYKRDDDFASDPRLYDQYRLLMTDLRLLYASCDQYYDITED